MAAPCAVFAPLVFVLLVLAIPLWPVAIVAVALTWCIVWPLERILRALGFKAMQGWSAWVAYALLITLKPAYFFHPVNVRAARRARFGIKPKSYVRPSDGG